MREHPVPQDITGYQFHIVGNMTIKQFAEILGGVLIAVLIYATNLPVFVKWPLIGLFAGAGALAAFVPFEEQPLDHWIIVFFKTLYKPTQYFWKKHAQIPAPFLYEPPTVQTTQKPELDLSPAKKERLKEYMYSIDTTRAPSALDNFEQQRMLAIMSTFDSVNQAPINAVPQPKKPNLRGRVRQLSAADLDSDFDISFYNQQSKPQTIYQAPTVVQPTEPASPADQRVEDVQIPEYQAVKVATSSIDEQLEQQDQFAPAAESLNEAAYLEPTIQTTQVFQQPTSQAFQNTALPFPTPPDQPNLPVGMVLTPNNDLIANAVIEIINEQGVIERAVKSNSLGQFFVSTPLKEGVYTLLAEKVGFQFAPQQLILDGEIIDPLELRSMA